MNLGLFIGIGGLLVILFFRGYFFEGRALDDEQGFPWSRRDHKRKRHPGYQKRCRNKGER
jgi:hypothetical protein